MNSVTYALASAPENQSASDAGGGVGAIPMPPPGLQYFLSASRSGICGSASSKAFAKARAPLPTRFGHRCLCSCWGPSALPESEWHPPAAGLFPLAPSRAPRLVPGVSAKATAGTKSSTCHCDIRFPSLVRRLMPRSLAAPRDSLVLMAARHEHESKRHDLNSNQKALSYRYLRTSKPMIEVPKNACAAIH
jgi:hypothetical protein